MQTRKALRTIKDYERTAARDDLIRQAQKESYVEEYQGILNNQPPKGKLFKKLRATMDKDRQIIVCVGRQQAFFTRHKLKPLVLLPSDHYITKLIIRHTHENIVGHMGMRAMISQLRRELQRRCPLPG